MQMRTSGRTAVPHDPIFKFCFGTEENIAPTAELCTTSGILDHALNKGKRLDVKDPSSADKSSYRINADTSMMIE